MSLPTDQAGTGHPPVMFPRMGTVDIGPRKGTFPRMEMEASGHPPVTFPRMGTVDTGRHRAMSLLTDQAGTGRVAKKVAVVGFGGSNLHEDYGSQTNTPSSL